MIFLRYESFRGYLKMYPVTSVLIALNLLIFCGDAIFDHELIIRGAFIDIPQDPFGLQEPWRYITSMFLHRDFAHLFYNMFALLVFAPPLENMLGSGRYAVFYLLSGLIANAVSAVIVTHPTISVGASGAIYGIYGAYLYLAVMKKSLDEGSRKTVYVILVFGVIYSLIAEGINLWAHIGGALAGFAMAYLYDQILIAKRRRS
ncbi:rhomboid family intramembrane serine protease [Paenibacillus sp. GCM10027626]|uniref:rhomboid family intramembrane serine protease n=1 Tax=Paenibacillus sp. GCM10027626 TaxID=3273411 RepID=UPI00363B1280